MKERLVRFSMFGQEFSFVSDAPDEEVERAVDVLRQEFEDTGRAGLSNIPSSKMLVLGCLRMAARYVRLQMDYQDYRQRQEKGLGKLIDKVSGELKE
ncbi:MAG: cell division protein ZapA [Desulfobulbus propionicus]|nr:MAG: cell division protein ZapA [Desulfobulbus propionicus]